MVRRVLIVVLLVGAVAAIAAAIPSFAGTDHRSRCHTAHSCPSDHHTYTWRGLYCTSKPAERLKSDTHAVSYGRIRYWCGLKKSGARALALVRVDIGRTVLLAPRTKTSGCRLGANPDRRCSPGAYYTGLTKAVLCSPGFHTSSVRNVPQSEKYAVEQEYGLTPRLYGRTLEIDHIVPLELGGSNQIANLYPEKADAQPGYAVKDRLENKLHQLVCSGVIALRAAQRQIAANWQALYTRVFGFAPPGISPPAPPAPTPTATPPAPTTTTSPPPVPTTTNTAPPPTTTAAPGNCDPSYPTVCIPPPPPDLDCADVPYRNFKVLPPDPHRFDGDHDGIGCES